MDLLGFPSFLGLGGIKAGRATREGHLPFLVRRCYAIFSNEGQVSVRIFVGQGILEDDWYTKLKAVFVLL